MPLAQRVAAHDDDPTEDHFVHLRDVSWSDYERVMRIRGEGSVPRLAYQKGVLELMSPSSEHEWIKSMIGRLVEVWCLENGVEFSAFGSWTLKNRKKETGVEPDECYVVGEPPTRTRPDLAIEVIWTSGGLDKRELYRNIGVPEVWFWRQGRITAHALRERGYHQVPRSQLLPGIDLAHLASFIDRPGTRMASKAILAYRAALQSKR